MELHEALAEISHIRDQVARTEVFRGYRSLTLGVTGLLALVAATVQTIWIPHPLDHIGGYLALWGSAAVLSMAIAGAEMAVRARASRLDLARQMTWLFVAQFLPCVVAGAVLTQVIVSRAAEAVWMLPGLWAILFSLGIFASYRLLPRQVFWVGVYYLICGVLCLAFGSGEAALWPWSMGLTFGVGQLFTAVILHLTLEQGDDQRR